MSTRTTSLRLHLASAALMFILAAPACRSDDGQPPDGTTGGEPTLQTSRVPNLQWKRAAAVEHDLERALALTRDQLCLEVGVAPCVEDPLGLGLYESLAAPLATTPIALDRVALSGCAARADLDRAAGPAAAVVFRGLDLAGPAPAADDPGVATMTTELYRRLLGRDPLAAEVSTIGALTRDESGPIAARDFAVLACYAIATTTEFLFF